jgi:hypothetical protein
MNCPKCNSHLVVDEFLYFKAEKCVNPNCYDHCHIVNYDCCVRPVLQVVKYIVSNGAIQVREQCTRCGRLKGNSLGGYTPEQKKNLPPIDEALREKSDNSWQQIHSYRSNYIDQQRTIRREAWMQAYSDYLASNEWKIKRETVLQRDGYLCQACLKNKASQVHHKSYEFVDFTGLEPCFDLVSICNVCHEKLHKIRNERKAS